MRRGTLAARDDEVMGMVVISEEAMVNSERESCFSFAKQGKLRWCSAVILAVYVIGTFAAIILIAVFSAHRIPPPISSDTHYNSNVNRSLAFTSWLPSCETVKEGEPFICATYVDCVMLSTSCAPSDILDTMQCQTVEMSMTVCQRVCVSVPLC
ncbi:hypothetical protein LSM04_008040 [Trypanosoma melophagium]|uniref:uncharacterized protein n=1 Tax=Trypanosoma melophagium TaxID=715481 RepID=UPI003519EB5C|nr:hypothetical protein LSM04_008040 [Trypanosoma melophagium]